MNKAELIEQLAGKVGADSKAEVGRWIDAFVDMVIGTLKKGDEVAIAGFGTFIAKTRAARTGRNPKTGESIQIKATKVPKFKAGKGFKDALK
ncbi:MAG: HU family DNA-binding protein [Patescibacteria group bacterium]|nr:HU family DNA-binding protein [Patescibacteria group bacterium]MDD5121259.1 HU family DNA-binding protein [Patescibacteria group bacterium]MDD5222163.1 HU family DNA-binding protein [Patescibacteria group bacterium]MDD5395822.1 HU family DNA-binding protein [Patescibacteria group bacterium]